MRFEFRTPIRLRHGWLLSAVLCAAVAGSARAEEPSREYRIKAAFLYNLTKFITWPDEATWAADAPITVCIYGFNPFDTYIRKLEQRTAKGRSLVLRYPTQPDQLRNCQMLFVSQYNAHKPDLRELQAELPGLLSVGDAPDFIAGHGMVGLVAAGNNVQLNIHHTRAREAGFAVSADLLEIAHKVE
jgi:hypothetical protein